MEISVVLKICVLSEMFCKTSSLRQKAGLIEDIIPQYVQCQYIVPLENIPQITIYKDVVFNFVFRRKGTPPCCDVLSK